VFRGNFGNKLCFIVKRKVLEHVMPVTFYPRFVHLNFAMCQSHLFQVVFGLEIHREWNIIFKMCMMCHFSFNVTFCVVYLGIYIFQLFMQIQDDCS
jgi:hypothetical protein